MRQNVFLLILEGRLEQKMYNPLMWGKNLSNEVKHFAVALLKVIYLRSKIAKLVRG